MTGIRPIFLGLLVGVAVYIGVWGLPRISAPQTATVADDLVTSTVSPTLSPSKLATHGDRLGDKSSVTNLSPTLSPSAVVSPRLSPSLSPTPVAISVGSVLINEIAWGGTSASPTDEWIELSNITSRSIDLNGWKILIVGDSAITLSGRIDGGGYYLLERTNDTVIGDVAADYAGSFGRYGLNNSGEHLTLVDPSGASIDDVNCGTKWFAGTATASMERLGTGWGTNGGTLTIGHDASGHPIRGTPRGANSLH